MFIDHIAAQGEHHAVDVLRAEAVEHQWLIEGDDVGHQVALATYGRAGQLDAEHRGQNQQPVNQGRSVRKASHDQ
ncbi:hypothetical protein D3C87_914920 [compost metagenome]